MEEHQNRKLAVMFLILAGLILVSGTVLHLMINGTAPQHKTDLPCYDRWNNVIIGLSCEGYYYPLAFEIIFGTAILIAICLAIARCLKN